MSTSLRPVYRTPARYALPIRFWATACATPHQIFPFRSQTRWAVARRKTGSRRCPARSSSTVAARFVLIIHGPPTISYLRASLTFTHLLHHLHHGMGWISSNRNRYMHLHRFSPLPLTPPWYISTSQDGRLHIQSDPSRAPLCHYANSTTIFLFLSLHRLSQSEIPKSGCVCMCVCGKLDCLWLKQSPGRRRLRACFFWGR